jgi:hypothetical protein
MINCQGIHYTRIAGIAEARRLSASTGRFYRVYACSCSHYRVREWSPPESSRSASGSDGESESVTNQ